MRQHVALVGLAVVYVLVGLVYALVTPVLEKPDEDAHYGYILYLRKYHTLPPLFSTASWAAEFRQPPLYYVITAVLTGWLPDDPNLGQLLADNPYFSSSVPGYRNDNRNLYLHPPFMTPLVLAARLVTLLFGLGTMVASYFLAVQLFPSRSLVPIVTAAVVGFQSKFLYMATAVNNDAAIAFWGALAAALLMYRLRKGNWPYFAVLVGVALGLASITKVSGLVFFPLVGLALLFIHRGFRPAFFRDGAIIVLVALLVGGWWYARNALLYSDPLTVGTHTTGFTRTGTFWSRLKHDLSSIEYTFWAHQSSTFISPIRLDEVLIWWGRTSLGLFALSVLLKYKSIQANQPALMVLASWPVTFLFLLVVYWNAKFSWPFGRLLFPAIAPGILLLVLGWQYALPARWRRLALMLNAGAAMVIGSLIPFVTLYPLFHPSREWQAKQVQHPVNSVYLDPEAGKQIVRLIGYNLPKPYALPGTYFPIELCWEPLGQTDVPYALFVQLLDLSQMDTHSSPTTWGRRETYPGLGNRPTDRWALHRAFCDTVLVAIFPETPTPLAAAIEVGFTGQEQQGRLQAVDAEGDPIELAIVGRMPILSSQELPVARQPTRYTLDHAIGLDRVQLSDDLTDSITLTLTWQLLQPVPYDAIMFVHLRGADGSVLAQVDRQPLAGRFPTSSWLPGQVVTDVVSLPIASDAYRGPLVLNIGMYTWPSMQRLPVTDTSGTLQRDNMISIDVPPSK